MKAPGWMSLRMAAEHGPDCVEPDGMHVHVVVRVKRWHPGYWLFVLRVWLGLEQP